MVNQVAAVLTEEFSNLGIDIRLAGPQQFRYTLPSQHRKMQRRIAVLVLGVHVGSVGQE